MLYVDKKDGKTIHCTRGDKGAIDFKIKGLSLGTGDTFNFRVYKKGEVNKGYVMDVKKVLTAPITTETATITMMFTSQDTTIGEMLNKKEIYWYELSLNEDITLIGIDENNAKEFILYPEGAKTPLTTEGE